jgi:hypothetical protein
MPKSSQSIVFNWDVKVKSHETQEYNRRIEKQLVLRR